MAKSFLLIFCFFLYSSFSNACSFGPGGVWNWKKEKLIQQTENIVIAELSDVIDLKEPDRPRFYGVSHKYILKVIQTLKGADPGVLSIVGDPPSQNSMQFSLESPRTFVSMSCDLMTHFEKGKRYLVFVGAYHPFANQEIIGENDKWLKFVKRRIAADRK